MINKYKMEMYEKIEKEIQDQFNLKTGYYLINSSAINENFMIVVNYTENVVEILVINCFFNYNIEDKKTILVFENNEPVEYVFNKLIANKEFLSQLKKYEKKVIDKYFKDMSKLFV